MSALTFVIVFVIAVYFWYWKKTQRTEELLKQFPSAKSLPILKHALYFANKKPPEIFKCLEEMAKAHGPMWKFELPFSTQILIHDPAVVEEILSSQKILDKSVEYDFVVDWLGTGLLISTGQKWHQRRKIITPTFHFKILEEFVDVMNRNGDVFVQKLKRFQGQEINIYPMISLYALDVICESAMGYRLNSQNDEVSDYVRAVKEITEIIFLRMFDPIKRIKFLYPFTSMCKREKEVVKTLHNFTDSVISNRREFLKGQHVDEQAVDEFGVKKKTAFLDLLLKVQVDGKPLDNGGIREEVDTFMFEGHDTTTSAIAFTLLNLAKHQDVQQRVLNECKEVFGNDCMDANPTMQDLNKLSYLESVLKESLRIYPPVPFVGRKLKAEFSAGGYTFPEGVTLNVSSYYLGRDPKLFPDPLKFDPSRFEDEKNVRLFSFVPFSAGPRNCIGQKFAMLELKSIVSKLVSNFKIKVSDENREPIIFAQLILMPANGINLSFEPRG